MNQLDINQLSVSTIIGVYPWEQKIKQKLWLDISIPGEFSTCQDDINRTIDYAQLCQQVTAYIESNAFALIETVAQSTLQLIQDQFKIAHLTVRVSKPSAVANASSVSITMSQ